jgi:hypothetical protein
VILGNLDKYGNLVYRYSTTPGPGPFGGDFIETCGDFLDPDDDEICFIALRKENRGRQKASGINTTLEVHDVKTAYGTFGARLSGTLALVSKQQTGNDDPYVSNLGKFVTDGVVSPAFRPRAGVQNLFDTAPPFSNQAFYSLSLSGYDPSYTDPRGRFFYLSGTYVFR